MAEPRPLVSVLVPCRNEQKFIRACLDSIVANDYPKEHLEVLVIDGLSEDGTREIVAGYARQHDFVKQLDNPKGITPAALNLGIRAARGELILWMSAHNAYPSDYISRLVDYSERFQADNVGGSIAIRPRNQTIFGAAVACALSHRFGVGNSHFRLPSRQPRWVDTVFGGCYRRSVFERIGHFNENLIRGQDLEFNLRLKRAGGRILLVPEVVSDYYARSEPYSYWRYNWSNGIWAILPFSHSPIVPVGWRHLVPLVLVTSLLASALLSSVVAPFRWITLTIASAYSLASLGASAQISIREREPRHLAALPVAFGLLHFGYGLGSLWGVLRVACRPAFWKRLGTRRRSAGPTHPRRGARSHR